MNIFRIYPAIGEDFICTTMADGPVEALDIVRRNTWVAQQLTDSAYAEKAEEMVEW